MTSQTSQTATVQAASAQQSNHLLLRGGEVATMLGISRALAFRWMQTGVLPTVRVRGARTVRVPHEALLEWIKANTQRAAA
jgi:excisionase family DNA binding protein